MKNLILITFFLCSVCVTNAQTEFNFGVITALQQNYNNKIINPTNSFFGLHLRYQPKSNDDFRLYANAYLSSLYFGAEGRYKLNEDEHQKIYLFYGHNGIYRWSGKYPYDTKRDICECPNGVEFKYFDLRTYGGLSLNFNNDTVQIRTMLQRYIITKNLSFGIEVIYQPFRN